MCFQIIFSHKCNYFLAKEPEYFFTQKLPEKYSVTRRKEAVLECFVSDPRAKVKWYRNGEPIDVSEYQIIFKFLHRLEKVLLNMPLHQFHFLFSQSFSRFQVKQRKNSSITYFHFIQFDLNLFKYI